MRAHPSPNAWAAKIKRFVRKYQGLRKAKPRNAPIMLPTPVNKATLEGGVPNVFRRSRPVRGTIRPLDVFQNTRVIHKRFG